MLANQLLMKTNKNAERALEPTDSFRPQVRAGELNVFPRPLEEATHRESPQLNNRVAGRCSAEPTLQGRHVSPMHHNPLPTRYLSLSDEGVSAEFVLDFNAHSGNEPRYCRANQLLSETEQLARSTLKNVPAARKNLLLLAGLNNLELKEKALKALLSLLQSDEIKRETAEGLFSFAFDLSKYMALDYIQAQIVDLQIMFCQVYGLTAELLQRHYAAQLINGVSKEQKRELLKPLEVSEKINTQNHIELHLAFKYAYEGFARLKDDDQKMVNFCRSFISLLKAAGDLYKADVSGCYDELMKALKFAKIDIKHDFYAKIFTLNQLYRNTKADSKHMSLLVQFVEDNAASDYEFAYYAINILTQICLCTDYSEHNRKIAFGCLTVFWRIKSFHLKPSVNPLLNFELPKLKDHNKYVQEHLDAQLRILRENAPDQSMTPMVELLLTESEQPVAMEELSPPAPPRGQSAVPRAVARAVNNPLSAPRVDFKKYSRDRRQLEQAAQALMRERIFNGRTMHNRLRLTRSAG